MPAISPVTDEDGSRPCGLVVDALGGAGGGGLGDRLVVGGLGGPALLAAALLHGPVDAGGGPAYRDRVGVVDVQLVEFVEHAEADGQALRVDARAVHRAVLCHRHCLVVPRSLARCGFQKRNFTEQKGDGKIS